MIRNFFCLIASTVILSGCVAVHESKHVSECKPGQVLRHVVLFKFKDDTSADQVREIESAFCALPSKVDAIYDFEWGTDVSVEGRADGFTHCFFVSFRSEADRAEYIPHPAHKEFGQLVGPHLDKVLVIDYWTKQ